MHINEVLDKFTLPDAIQANVKANTKFQLILTNSMVKDEDLFSRWVFVIAFFVGAICNAPFICSYGPNLGAGRGISGQLCRVFICELSP